MKREPGSASGRSNDVETNTALMTEDRTAQLQSLAVQAGWLALELDDPALAASCEAFADLVFDQLLTRLPVADDDVDAA
jgi:hypothetical protein